MPSLPMNEDWSRVLVLAQWLDSIWVAPSPPLEVGGGGVGAGRSWEGASLHWCKVGTFHLLLFIRLSTLFST